MAVSFNFAKLTLFQNPSLPKKSKRTGMKLRYFIDMEVRLLSADFQYVLDRFEHEFRKFIRGSQFLMAIFVSVM